MRDYTDLKLGPAIFDRINHIFGPLEVDLCCVQADLPTVTLLQLEIRSIGGGNGCFSTGLGTPERVCQPFLVPHRESSELSDDSESPGNPGSSNLERSAMVPSSPEHALGVSSEDTSTPQTDSGSSGTGSSSANSPASRVGKVQ